MLAVLITYRIIVANNSCLGLLYFSKKAITVKPKGITLFNKDIVAGTVN